MTQEDLAKKSDRDRRNISDIENNNYKPSFETLVNLAYSFNILPSELLLEIEKKSNFLEYYNQSEQSGVCKNEENDCFNRHSRFSFSFLKLSGCVYF